MLDAIGLFLSSLLRCFSLRRTLPLENLAIRKPMPSLFVICQESQVHRVRPDKLSQNLPARQTMQISMSVGTS